MDTQSLLQTQESPLRLPGTWKLAPGQAISLRPSRGGQVRVAHGRVWATYDGPHGGRPDDSGDEVVGSGGTLVLRAGQRIVMEAWGVGQPAYFSWEPVDPMQAVQARRIAAVTQPLSDLRLALVFGAGALGRLLAGVAALAVPRSPARQPEAAACAHF